MIYSTQEFLIPVEKRLAIRITGNSLSAHSYISQSHYDAATESDVLLLYHHACTNNNFKQRTTVQIIFWHFGIEDQV